MQYKDCIIVYKGGQAISLRATKLIVENENNLSYVYNNDDIMAILPLDEIKTILLADCGGPESVSALVDAINGANNVKLNAQT